MKYLINDSIGGFACFESEKLVNEYMQTQEWRYATEIEIQAYLTSPIQQKKQQSVSSEELYVSKITAYIRSQGYTADRVEAIVANLEIARSNPSLPKSIEYINEYKAYQAVRVEAKRLANLVNSNDIDLSIELARIKEEHPIN